MQNPYDMELEYIALSKIAKTEENLVIARLLKRKKGKPKIIEFIELGKSIN